MKVAIQLARDPEARVTLSNKVLMRAQTIAMALVSILYLGVMAFEVYLITQPWESWHEKFGKGIGTSFLSCIHLAGNRKSLPSRPAADHGVTNG